MPNTLPPSLPWVHTVVDTSPPVRLRNSNSKPFESLSRPCRPVIRVNVPMYGPLSVMRSAFLSPRPRLSLSKSNSIPLIFTSPVKTLLHRFATVRHQQVIHQLGPVLRGDTPHA